MPINGISVGRDVNITLNDNNGPVASNRVKSFTSKQKTSNKETAALDGINRHINIPMGWEGSFEMERTSSVIDDYFANLENNVYYAGQNLSTITLTETITEVTGAVTQYQYVGVVVSFDGQDWKADDYVTQKISFSAQQRKKLQ